MEELINILQASVDEHGSQPLTTTQLLYMLKLAKKNKDRKVIEEHLEDIESYWAIRASEHCNKDTF